ncbi:hypothetical protein SG18_24320 [Pandoraea apista]|nr:hypothetical protein SG18_24320 [Pandoraea apista]AKH74705.1 hypothetical protein XM39_24500 [Pandoraea apista]AKI61766.1 hypothetical protein AA956_08195 [Pandoraea apista]
MLGNYVRMTDKASGYAATRHGAMRKTGREMEGDGRGERLYLLAKLGGECRPVQASRRGQPVVSMTLQRHLRQIAGRMCSATASNDPRNAFPAVARHRDIA